MKRVVAGIIAVSVVAATVLLFKEILREPSIDPKLVGKWESPQGYITKEYRNDGTYTSRSLESNVRGHRNVVLTSAGTWRYKDGRIYATCTAQSATKDGKPYPQIFKVIESNVGRTGSTPIRWRNDDSWTYTEVGIGYFERVR
jgi:hypothetical protein